MPKSEKILALDAGNTSVKAGLFTDGLLVGVKRFETNSFGQLKTYIEKENPVKILFSTVLNEAENKTLLALSQIPFFRITREATIPVRLQYETPETLGMDRVCNASAALGMLKTSFGVVIDIGTCVKFDLIDKDGSYFGGSISPGIGLRYRSLFEFTGNLPLISNKNTAGLVGSSTETSIRSGVMNGMKAEIEGIMDRYSGAYRDLTFFVTGGDAPYFDLQSKNNIFADENLTLKGLYEIYRVNR